MTTKTEILKAIRDHCLECCCGSEKEVSICAVGSKCHMFDFRFGKDPRPARNGNVSNLNKTKLSTEGSLISNDMTPIQVEVPT